jgi:hypothetical protein
MQLESREETGFGLYYYRADRSTRALAIRLSRRNIDYVIPMLGNKFLSRKKDRIRMLTYHGPQTVRFDEYLVLRPDLEFLVFTHDAFHETFTSKRNHD